MNPSYVLFIRAQSTYVYPYCEKLNPPYELQKASLLAD